jgi:hypothetical protein
VGEGGQLPSAGCERVWVKETVVTLGGAASASWPSKPSAERSPASEAVLQGRQNRSGLGVKMQRGSVSGRGVRAERRRCGGLKA